ncbi:hypothetical protein DPEC_G00046380 [Dallia pectoralis]|uniref:Uncharacterized protein n=1 Tax=Dallia pectoralis TaxID=75939 RepID=A0ACC2HAN5_DALPE|nr:hypothetical protein DPEC_G00046380 [Dallia pectoralis]
MPSGLPVSIVWGSGGLWRGSGPGEQLCGLQASGAPSTSGPLNTGFASTRQGLKCLTADPDPHTKPALLLLSSFPPSALLLLVRGLAPSVEQEPACFCGPCPLNNSTVKARAGEKWFGDVGPVRLSSCAIRALTLAIPGWQGPSVLPRVLLSRSTRRAGPLMNWPAATSEEL